MTYTKPANITYTQMCQYFDKHIYEIDRNDTILYQYLYHIIYMLACKQDYFRSFDKQDNFRNFDEYDNFALYASSIIYMRILSNLEKKPPKKIKSILNYVKGALYYLKVDYQKESYKEIINLDLDVHNSNKKIDTTNLKNNLYSSIEKEYSYQLSDDILNKLMSIPTLIKKIVEDECQFESKLIRKNIYLSCLLSFLKSITLSTQNIKRITRRESKNIVDNDNLSIKLYQTERESSITIWHLDAKKYYKIINLLLKKINTTVAKDILNIKNSYELTLNELDNIIVSSMFSLNSLARNKEEKL